MSVVQPMASPALAVKAGRSRGTPVLERLHQEEAELALKLAQMPSAVHKTVSAAEVSHFFKPLMHLTDATRDYLRRYRGPCGETRLKLLNSIKNVLEQGMKIAQIA